MSIVEQLRSDFQIEAYGSPATEKSIAELCAVSSIDVPEDYITLVRKMTEVEILTDEKKFVRIWAPERCMEMNEAYEVQKYIPNSLAIGDDEGGDALILMTGKSGFGLYKVGFGDLDASDAEFIGRSLFEYLTLSKSNSQDTHLKKQ